MGYGARVTIPVWYSGETDGGGVLLSFRFGLRQDRGPSRNETHRLLGRVGIVRTSCLVLDRLEQPGEHVLTLGQVKSLE